MTKTHESIITPPNCLGIVGGGQLGRMFTIAAKQMGYQVAVLEPDEQCPTHKLADFHIKKAYTDKDGLNELAQLSSVITTEFENVPSSSISYLEEKNTFYPSAEAILIAQNRLKEKAFFNSIDVKTAQFAPITNNDDIKNISIDMFPAILKTNTLGYDGKGQVKVVNHTELQDAFNKLNNVECILEKIVNLKLEVSVIVARSQDETVTYPISENQHVNGILDLSIVPARISQALEKQLQEKAINIANQLNYIGILAIEFFITQDDQILANEMAPRPHNSGHYTIEACLCSQFEQQVRAICNLKLGSTKLHQNIIMLNLLGDIWQNETTHPMWEKILKQYANVKLHLYEKTIAKNGRKMGHLTISGDNQELLFKQVNEIKHMIGI